MGRKERKLNPKSSFSFFLRVSSFFQRFSRSFPFRYRPQARENELSDIQKTAVFFLSLPPEATARLIGTLSTNEIRHITSEMRQLDHVTPTAQKEVIREFCSFLLEEGKLPDGTTPTREAVHHIADRDPKGIMGVLRRHWLTPKWQSGSVNKELLARLKPEERAGIILSHFPVPVLKKILPQLSTDEVERIGKGMLQLTSIPDDVQQHVWNSLSRWFRGNLDDQESIVKGIHHLLQDESLPDYPPPPDYAEKTVFLLRLLKPRESKEIGKKLLESLERSEQEGMILALRQLPQELGEREKNLILEEFFSFVKRSFAPRGTLRDEDLMEEIERLGLQRPKDVARSLEAHWLSRGNNLGHWRDLAERHPNFAAQKLAEFIQQKGKRWETSSHLQKCALFLKLIHPEIRAEVVKYIDDESARLVCAEIEKPWRVSSGEKRGVLEEFLGQYYFQSTAKLLQSNTSGSP